MESFALTFGALMAGALMLFGAGAVSLSLPLAAVIGLLIGVLGALIVYLLMKNRIERLVTALQNNQRRLQQLESEHEIRLRAATDQLQADYERQLAEKIEYYQDDQILQTELMELEFETRLSVVEDAFSRELEMQR